MKRVSKIFYDNGRFVLDKSEYDSLFSKGFGFEDRGKFFLDSFEVLYLLEAGKIEVFKNNKKVDFDMLFKFLKMNVFEYNVFKDLVLKGYNVKSGAKFGCNFRIYDKSFNEKERHSIWLVDVVLDKNNIKFKDLLGKNRVAHSTKKKMLFAIVDSDNSITYIENSWKKI